MTLLTHQVTIGGIVESPYGDDVDGKWVAYGKAGFGGASTSTTLLSGWAEEELMQVKWHLEQTLETTAKFWIMK